MPKHPFQISLDQKAKAAYIQFSTSAVAETVEAAGGLLLDLDDRGTVVGIEILTTATLAVLTQHARELREAFPSIPELDPQEIREIESFFQRMTA